MKYLLLVLALVILTGSPSDGLTRMKHLSPGSAIKLSSIALNPTSVVGGNSSQGTVTLTKKAPSGGVVVTLSSNQPSVASVPASVTVASGQTTGVFTVTTSAVSVTTVASISASYGGVTKTANLTVRTAADTTAPVISAVATSGITSGGAAITWTTNEASDSQVDYGTTTAYGSSTTLNSALVTSHSAMLSGLSAGTLYHYRVKSRDAAGNLATLGDFIFTTTQSGGSGFVIEGFGSNTTGGVGGTVYIVSNLNDSGAGSLRDVIDRTGPRIIKFAVSGTIVLQSPLIVTQSSVTIDGSDAPNGGICLRNSTLEIRASNVIVRYIRIRPGELGGTSIDCVQLIGGSDIVIDHCSLSWGDDENIDQQAQNVTIQWCIISENVGSGALLMNYGTNPTTTIHHNLFANNGARLPEMGIGNADFVNNVFYDWYLYGRTLIFPGCNGCGGGGPIQANIVGNYYIPGSSSTLLPAFSKEVRLFDGGFASSSSVYLNGNISPNRPTDDLAQDALVWDDNSGIPYAGARFNFPPVTTTSAAQAYNDVLANAGARLPCLDAVDRRVLLNVQNRTGSLISNPSEVGGWPDLTQSCP